VEGHGSDDRVPIFDRLFLGGARTLRGFKFRDVGPKDETGEPIGGKTAWYATAEYTIPIVDKVRFATFYDIGMVFEDSYEIDFSDVNSDFGIGIRLDFPGFPLRLDYAWPLETDEFNDRKSGRFQFSIGYVF
jgi:outer membrane protein insertion porin family